MSQNCGDRGVPTAPDGIAIIGMSGRFPGARDLASFWANLAGGVESIARFDREELLAAGVDPRLVADPNYVPAAGVLEEVEAFDAELFGYSPREAELMDPQQRLFLECAWAALEHAGYPPRGGADRVGVFAGSGLNGYLLHHVLGDPELLERVGPYQAVIGNDKDFLATRVSYKLGLEGPSLTVQTACSTSLVAICVACQSLLDGECDRALAGGVNVRVPQRAGYLYQEEGILSPDGHCRAFDALARGTVPGSGIGVVVLKPLARALADRDRVHAVIRGWAINNDGARKVGFTAPSVEGQSAAVAEALALADVDPATISYIEAHGTGTRLGDPIEIAALSQVFGGNESRSRPCAIGSLKTNVGHLDAAAGVAGLIKTVLALDHHELPPTLHFQSPNPEIDLAGSPFRVVAQRTPWEADGAPRRAGVSSFGIGGTNAHLVVEEAPASEPTDPAPSHALLVVSARSEEALDSATTRLTEHLRQHPDVSVHDVAYTLQTGRVAMPHRRAAVCTDAPSACAALESRDPGRARSGAAEDSVSVAFLFPGQGTQHLGMGATLYASSARFAEELDRCASLLAPHLNLDLREALFRVANNGNPARAIDQTALAQPALFAIEYSLARAWMDLGVMPEAMLGHSVGEYVAACLSGALPLEDALRVVAARGRLMQALPPGAMAAVPLAEAALAPLLPPGVSLAAVNGPELCTVSGTEEGVGAMERTLGERGLESRRLHTSHAFHSAMMDPALDAFRKELGSVAWGSSPAIPWISNLTGTWITPDEARRPEYWVRHLRETVRFAEGLQTLLARPDRVLLEAGPGHTLTALARRHPAARGRRVLPSMPHPQEPTQEPEAFLRAAGELWVCGVPIRWAGLHHRRRRSRVPLPTYPFERARHWLAAPRPGAGRRSGSIFKRPDPTEWLYLPTWKRAGPRDLVPPENPDRHRPARWLVFEDGGGLGAALAKALEASGADVSRAHPGEGFARLGPREYRVSPGRRQDHEALLAALRDAEGLPEGVLHLWSLPHGTYSESDPQRGFTSLLACVQALAPLSRGARTRIAIISEGLQSVTGSERSDPERATVLGLCKVVPQEYPHFSCRSIDVVTAGEAPEQVAESLLAEIESAAEEPEVALRGGHRWVPAYDPAPLPSADPAAEALLDPGAHVLIVGGLGRLGLALASHFARTHNARLTLLDRLPCPLRDRWVSLAERDGSAEAATARALLELVAEGTPFEVMQADVAEAESLTRAVADAERRFGPIAAIVHAAGPADEVAYRTIQEITPEHWAGHFTPKLAGLRALAGVFQGRPPMLAVIASSLAPVLGGVGLAAMAAADRFVGAFVEQPTPPGGIPWRAIDWEGWGQRWADRELAVLGRGQIELMLTWPEVAEVLERALRARGVPRLVVSTGDLEARRAQWTRVLEGGTPRATRAAVPSNGGRPPAEGTEASVAAVWGEVLGIDAIGADDDFFELGGNSLLGLQVLSRLRSTFQVEMPLRTFFEARTVAAMTRVIEEERAASSDQTQRIATLLDEIESLSDEEIESRLLALPAGEQAREEGA